MRARQRPRGSLALVLVLVLVLAVVSACARHAPARAQALDRAALTARIDRILELEPAQDRLRAIVVQRDGHVVYEHYQQADRDERWNSDAITSTVLATLVGIALHEKRIPGLQSTLAELLPGRAATMPRSVARTTLRQLLTMTAGFDVLANRRAAPFLEPADPTVKILRSQVSSPGGQFAYSDQGAHLLSAIISQATGMSALAYARLRLFGPLGIDTRPSGGRDAEPLGTPTELSTGGDFAWATARDGTDDGWSGLRLRPLDLARLGQVYLDDGRWKGRQVVPENWARVSTLTQVATGYNVAPGYGYGWWVDERNGRTAYYGWGYAGQLLEVLPQDRVVVVVMTQQQPDNLVRGFFTAELTFLVDQAILPALDGS